MLAHAGAHHRCKLYLVSAAAGKKGRVTTTSRSFRAGYRRINGIPSFYLPARMN